MWKEPGHSSWLSPLSARLIVRVGLHPGCDFSQLLAVLRLVAAIGQLEKLFGVDAPCSPGGELGASEHIIVVVLPVGNGVDGTAQRSCRACVVPVGVGVERDDVQQVLLEEQPVEVCHLELPTGARLECLGEFYDLAGVEVGARNGKRRLRRLGLLFKRDGTSTCIKLNNTEVFRLLQPNPVSEYQGSANRLPGLLHGLDETVPIEDVVAEHQRHVVVADEVAADDERFCDASRFLLDVIREVDVQAAAVAEYASVVVDVVGCCDDEDVGDAGIDHVGDGVVNRRFVVHIDQPLAYSFAVEVQTITDRTKSRAASGAQYNSLHGFPPVVVSVCRECASLL